MMGNECLRGDAIAGDIGDPATGIPYSYVFGEFKMYFRKQGNEFVCYELYCDKESGVYYHIKVCEPKLINNIEWRF